MEAAISKIIPKEKWDTLSKANQDFLLKIGFKCDTKKPKIPAENPQRVKERRSTAPKEYYLTQRIQCYCCHSVQILHGIMELPYEKAPYLKFRKLSEIPAEFDLTVGYIHRSRSTSTCISCRETLLKLSKDELIDKLMEKYNGCLAALGGDKVLLSKHPIYIREDKTVDQLEEERLLEEQESEVESALPVEVGIEEADKCVIL